MHGLNTKIQLDYLQPVTYTYGVGQPFQSYAIAFGLTNAFMQQFIPSMNNPDYQRVEYWIKRFYLTIYYTNCGMYNTWFEVTTLVCRLDMYEDFRTVVNDSVFGISATSGVDNTPFMSLGISPTFRKRFKILNSKLTILKPGGTKRVNVPITRKYKRRPIMGAIEGTFGSADPAPIFLKGSIIKVVRFWGSICNWTNSVGLGSNITGFNPVVMRGIQKTYLSYTRMDDAQPDTFYINNLGTSSIGTTGNIAANPTYVEYNKGNNPLAVESIVPNTTYTLTSP